MEQHQETQGRRMYKLEAENCNRTTWCYNIQIQPCVCYFHCLHPERDDCPESDFPRSFNLLLRLPWWVVPGLAAAG